MSEGPIYPHALEAINKLLAEHVDVFHKSNPAKVVTMSFALADAINLTAALFKATSEDVACVLLSLLGTAALRLYKTPEELAELYKKIESGELDQEPNKEVGELERMFKLSGDKSVH